MVATITPVGHGGHRGRWAGSVGLHALGAGGGAAAFGTGLGLVGRAIGAPWGGAGLLLLAGAAALYAARELVGLPIPIPERRRQVPQWWRSTFPAPLASFLYGAGLGIGFLTYLRHGTLVAVGAAAALSGDPAVGALLLAPFGLARGLGIGITLGGRTAERVSGLVDRLERIAVSRGLHLANGATLVAVGAVAAVGAEVAGLHAPARALLGVVFAWAAAAKALNPRGWREALGAYRLGPLTPAAAVIVPLSELGVPALLLAGHQREAAVLAASLLSVFAIVALRAGRSSDHKVPCGCFGTTKRRDSRVIAARNLALLVTAGIVAVGPAARPVEISLPGPGEMFPALLAALGLAIGMWIVGRSLSLMRGGYRGSG